MKSKTKNMGVFVTGLMSLISGCQSTGRDIRVGEYKVSPQAHKYIVNELKSAGEELSREGYEHFCENFSGDDKYLTIKEAEEGLLSLTRSSPRY